MDKYYFFKSYHEALKGIKPATRYIIREAIDNFMFEDKEPVFKDLLARSIWSLMLPTLKNSKVKYNNGKSRGRTEANQEQNPKQTESKSEANLEQNPSKSGAKQEQSSSLLPVCSSKEKGERKKEINNTPIIPQGGVASAFDKFWEAYPRKVGKQAARRAFDRARKLTTLDNILNAVERQKSCVQWQKENGAYIPHPATWLNQGRWDDDCGEQVIEEKPRKPVPKVSQCPTCGSYDLAMTMDRCICRGCGAVYDYNHVKGRWEKAE